MKSYRGVSGLFGLLSITLFGGQLAQAIQLDLTSTGTLLPLSACFSGGRDPIIDMS